MKHLSLQRAKQLEETIGFLSNYTSPVTEEHQIGNSSNAEDRDEKFTKLLIELGEVNERRLQIINEFKNSK